MAAQLKPATQIKYYPFNGGLDVVTPALSVDPGFCLAMVNYEPWYNGGYRRVDGYERFDGHTAPSAGTSYGLTMSALTGITGVGTSTTTNPNCYQPGTGVTSGATCIVTSAITVGGTSYLGITNIVGTFATGELIYIGTTSSTGSTLTVPSVGNSPGSATGTDGYTYASEFNFGMQNYYRQQIGVVPGTGHILGMWSQGTYTYAFRGTQTIVSGTATLKPVGAWLASASGWTQTGLTYATTIYYSGLLSTVQAAQFTASLDQTGVLIVTAMTTGTIYANGTLGDYNGLVPIGATIIGPLSAASTGQTGTYQLSVSPSIPVTSETMFTVNPPAVLPSAGQVICGATSSATGTVAYAISHDTTVGYIALSTASYLTGTLTFISGEVLRTIVGGVGTAFGTAAAAGTAFSLPVWAGTSTSGPSQGINHFAFKNANFYGTTTAYNVYGVNGHGPAFQIDENNLITPILMPLSSLPNQPGVGSWPFLLEAYQGFLYLAFPGGQLEQSTQGSPLQFNGFLGAAQFGVGEELTGLFSIVGPNLVIETKRSAYALSGNSSANFVMSLISEKAGAFLHSGQLLDTVYAINGLGITSLSRTQSYGNFVGSTVSQLIQPIITGLRPHFRDSTIVRASNQVRYYFDDGSCLIMYVPGLGQQNKAWSAIETGVTAQFGYATYPSGIDNCYNSEDVNNAEVRFFSLLTGDGFVYHDGVGGSFDGAAITSYVRLAFNNIGSPAVRKYFRRADVEINTTSQIALKFGYDLSYSQEGQSSSIANLSAATIPTNSVFGGGGYWNSVYWNQFYWDGQSISSARALLGGTGVNIGFLVYHSSAVDLPFVLQGLTLYYDPRRLQR